LTTAGNRTKVNAYDDIGVLSLILQKPMFIYATALSTQATEIVLIDHWVSNLIGAGRAINRPKGGFLKAV